VKKGRQQSQSSRRNSAKASPGLKGAAKSNRNGALSKTSDNPADPALKQLDELMNAHLALMSAVEQKLTVSDPYRGAQAASKLRVALQQIREAHEQIRPAARAETIDPARYQDLFESAPDGYVVTDMAGKINDVNSAAAMMLNVARNYLTLKPLGVYIAQSDRDRYWTAMHSMRHLARGEWIFQLIPRERPSIIVQATANVMLSNSGAVAGLRWILRDITQQQEAVEHAAESREKLSSLASNISAAEERERRRIAVELHDRLSQPLAMTRMSIGRLKKTATPEQLKLLDEMAALLDKMIQESRTLTFEISPPALYEIGFGAAVSSLGDILQRDHNLRVDVREDAPIEPEETRVLLFQFTRELLMNIVKHAKATAAIVTVRHNGKQGITVTIADDGSGFNAAKVSKSRASYGLFSIRTRLEQVGGFMRIDSGPSSGTRVTLSIPVKGNPAVPQD
jgi:PAS domain S-box-containing protein